LDVFISTGVIVDKLISLKHIVTDAQKNWQGLLPISKATWYRGISEGRYPKPIQISPGRSAWRLSDIENLINGSDTK